uniref:Mitochondrial ribosomal protein S7 n=1 Tax=Athene cunicularia TaxID=194338 RepID=A0A663LS32_ATHCN
LLCYKTCILVSALSLPFPGFWPRFVLLGLLTPNAMSDKDTEELEEKEVKPELENPQLARKPSAQTLEAIKRKQLEKYHKAPEDEKETIECNPYVIFHQALKNCQPIIGLSNITKGGKTYQVKGGAGLQQRRAHHQEEAHAAQDGRGQPGLRPLPLVVGTLPWTRCHQPHSLVSRAPGPGRSWAEEGKVEDPFQTASELNQGKLI